MIIFSRLLISNLWHILLSTCCFAQTFQVTTPQKTKWNLDKFLWNHGQPKASAHKVPIDFDAIDQWQQMGDYLSLSDNGEYFAYTINHGSGSNNFLGKLDSLIIQSTTTSWRQSFANAKPGVFSGDGKSYVFQNNEILCSLMLGKGLMRSVNGLVAHKFNGNGTSDWIAYQLNNSDSNVVLQNLNTGKENYYKHVLNYSFDKSGEWFICEIKPRSETDDSKDIALYQLKNGHKKRFSFVEDYVFSNSGKAVLLKIRNQTDSGVHTSLEFVSLPQGHVRTIWSTQESYITLISYYIDEFGKQVVFSTLDTSSSINAISTYNIWCYQEGLESAVLKFTNQIEPMDRGNLLEGPISFTDDGRYIQFYLKPEQPAHEMLDSGRLQVKVWNYNDIILNSLQADLFREVPVYKAIVDAKTGQLVLLESENQTIDWLQGDFALVRKSSKVVHGDRFWENGYGKDSIWLVSLSTGSRNFLPTRGGSGTFWFSPGVKYLVFWDGEHGCHYFSYNLQTGKLKNISSNVPAGQFGLVDPFLIAEKEPKMPIGLAAWLQNDEGLLVYDNNDIWTLDLEGNKPAINITNNFGRLNAIVFSLFNSHRNQNEVPIVDRREPLLLRAFNSRNKHNGFYCKKPYTLGDPDLLSIGPYFMHIIPWCQDPNLSNKGMQPVKARDVDMWIVQRQSSNDAPNYYQSTDFKSFKRLTNFQPHANYNWLTQELHPFKHLDGSSGQGILYKPANFDSTKQYPVLIVFYGGYTNSLYQFSVPAYNSNAITPGESPVWFLNNGYLIFTPDIYVRSRKYGPEAFNVIEGAANYLKTLSYVDANGLGCSAHSWSAKLASYIFTHSRSFRAMAISEGFIYANMINVALSTDENGVSKLEKVEDGFNFGSLWSNKDLWLAQTTVLNVDKAISPLFLLCNKRSSSEYQNQTLQLFTALRRLEKKVWWLQYEKGDHALNNSLERKDYTVRYTQYFNHFLKRAPAPIWMTTPYILKGVESGYELDPGGSCSMAGKDDCSICKAWNAQYKRTPAMFTKSIVEWKLDSDLQLTLNKEQQERAKINAIEGEKENERILKILKGK